MAAKGIEARSLAREYKGGVVAVAGIDLHVDEGEIYGFLGPNGAGKSTTVHMLTTLLPPSSGTATVAGFDIVKQGPAVRKAIGAALQEAALDPILTGREHMRLQTALHALPREERKPRGDELLERVGLADRARTRLARFSRGMLRRFGLAQAWLGAPELVLLDEPTAGLDAQGFEVLEDLLGEAHARGASLVIASHLPADIETHCDKLAVILDGAIAACGAPRELLREKTLLDLYRGLSAGARSEA
jgi:ABC-2 type transport system ATP-binding protein